jgi:hypothetical protein
MVRRRAARMRLTSSRRESSTCSAAHRLRGSNRAANASAPQSHHRECR